MKRRATGEDEALVVAAPAPEPTPVRLFAREERAAAAALGGKTEEEFEREQRREERERKREARLAHKRSEFAQKVHGIRAKLYNERRFKEKATMRKTIAQHSERSNKHANDDAVAEGAVPAYLLDREGVSRAKVLSNTVKQKRKEKAGKWNVPIPKVCLLYTSPSPRDATLSRMPSSA